MKDHELSRVSMGDCVRYIQCINGCVQYTCNVSIEDFMCYMHCECERLRALYAVYGRLCVLHVHVCAVYEDCVCYMQCEYGRLYVLDSQFKYGRLCVLYCQYEHGI